MSKGASVIRRGTYNIDYYTGSQASIYIGDIWVDEITSIDYQLIQDRKPIYGYASTLYDDLSEGQVLVQGQFTINFKEAGYLWLVLNRYRTINKGGSNLMDDIKNPFKSSSTATRQNVEQIVNGELTVYERNEQLKEIANEVAITEHKGALKTLDAAKNAIKYEHISASLGGYSSSTRGRGRIGKAENMFEVFENAVWGERGIDLDNETRRTDDPRLNPFDIYVAFGDFAGDDEVNHTIERLRDVTILGKGKQIRTDNGILQEQYSFLARNWV